MNAYRSYPNNNQGNTDIEKLANLAFKKGYCTCRWICQFQFQKITEMLEIKQNSFEIALHISLKKGGGVN